mmetsp:Transcript_68099/g.160194  ORF Transcript_68099/g.160194 Transcript_68099/m.160194 type:complete len:235 (+) Transcript_68099:69-773(+)
MRATPRATPHYAHTANSPSHSTRTSVGRSTPAKMADGCTPSAWRHSQTSLEHHSPAPVEVWVVRGGPPPPPTTTDRAHHPPAHLLVDPSPPSNNGSTSPSRPPRTTCWEPCRVVQAARAAAAPHTNHDSTSITRAPPPLCRVGRRGHRLSFQSQSAMTSPRTSADTSAPATLVRTRPASWTVSTPPPACTAPCSHSTPTSGCQQCRAWVPIQPWQQHRACQQCRECLVPVPYQA